MWAALGQADPEPRGRKLSNEVPGDEVPDGDRRWGASPETTIGRRRAALHLSTHQGKNVLQAEVFPA